MWCSPFVFTSHSRFGKEKLYLQCLGKTGGGGVCVCVCVCVCNTQCYSGFTPQRPPLCLLNKENSNQRIDGYGLLPLSPATEINDRDKHALSLSLTHTQTRKRVSSLYCLCMFTQTCRSCRPMTCPLLASTHCFTSIWQLLKLVLGLPTEAGYQRDQFQLSHQSQTQLIGWYVL